MNSIVCWRWKDERYGHALSPEYYNLMAAMIARHVTLPDWRFVVMTDDERGLDSSIEVRPLPSCERTAAARNPYGDKFPSCYRRLWLFSEAASRDLGGRILNIDVDAIIVRNIDHILSRTETFVGWTDPQFKWKKVAGGLYSLQTGEHTEVYDDFDPIVSPRIQKDAKMFGSDQGWMSYKLYPPPGEYTRKDGAYYAKWLPRAGRELNEEAAIIQTPGELKPWQPHARKVYPWISTHWTT